MRLIQINSNGDLALVEHDQGQIPEYAVLSHTWGQDKDEVTYKDISEGTGRAKAGYGKIEFCIKQTTLHGLQHFWIDTCCIDKSSSSELTEAINSMFNWYRNATRCYVYLSDVSMLQSDDNLQSSPQTWEKSFQSSRWFSRGWTLQELIAPASVEFFSKEGNPLGDQLSLESQIQQITGIPISLIRRQTPLTDFTVQERMSWANNRNTRRPEDKAYSLLGLFDVYMPLIYGEGERKAMKRLQEEIEKSSRAFNTANETILVRPSMVPFRADKDFVDREMKNGCGTLLEHIEQLCKPAASRVALVGIGGSGKSQLAIEFCHRLHKRSPTTWIFWIYAGSVERIEQGYREIAEQAKVLGREDPQNNIFELVTRWLQDEKNGKWLLVLDNADDDAIIFTPQTKATQVEHVKDGCRLQGSLQKYLPQCANGTLLITTRTTSVAHKLVEFDDTIIVDPMAQNDAIALLTKKLGGLDTDSDLKELADILEYMPLALVQAAAFIRQRGSPFDVQSYIENFKKSDKRKMSLLDHEAGHLRRDPEAKNSIIITWQISFDYLHERWPSSANLLALMSFFDRQGIPSEVLTAQLPQVTNDGDQTTDSKINQDGKSSGESNSEEIEEDATKKFEEDIVRLRNYSFISTGVDEKTFSMHRLIQLAIRNWLAMHGQEERYRGEFCQKLDVMFPFGDYEFWHQCERLYPHARAAERQRPKEDFQKLSWCRIMNRAGYYMLNRGSYDEAERLCIKSMHVQSKLLGKEHPDALSVIYSLAMIYCQQARLTEASNLAQEVLELMRRVRGEEHAATLNVMSSLADIYRLQGRTKEAKQLIKKVIEVNRKSFGEEQIGTLRSQNTLVVIYLEQGRFDQAEKLNLKVYRSIKKLLGEQHPSTVTIMSNQALIYTKQDRWKEAEQLNTKVLELRRKMLGNEHADVLLSMSNLALTYRKQDRLAEAEKMNVEVVEAKRRVLGDKHPETIGSLNNLALVYSEQGRLTEAEELKWHVLEVGVEVLGEKHPLTLTAISNLAFHLARQGRLVEAITLMSERVESRIQVFGPEHPETLKPLAALESWKKEEEERYSIKLTEEQQESTTKVKEDLGDDIVEDEDEDEEDRTAKEINAERGITIKRTRKEEGGNNNDTTKIQPVEEQVRQQTGVYRLKRLFRK